MKKLAIIPARGGSKRIPRKNIRLFAGRPVIAWSIAAARESGLFDEVMVSTDDGQIAAVARDWGAAVPFIRSAETAGDMADLSDVATEVLGCYREKGVSFDVFCCVLPSSPLIDAERIREGYEKLTGGEWRAVVPVVPFSYPIQRSLAIREGELAMAQPEFMFARSQDLEPRFHDAGQFYWMYTEEFLKYKTFFPPRCGAIVLEETEVQDIDNETDWAMAELKFERLKNKASGK